MDMCLEKEVMLLTAIHFVTIRQEVNSDYALQEKYTLH